MLKSHKIDLNYYFFTSNHVTQIFLQATDHEMNALLESY